MTADDHLLSFDDLAEHLGVPKRTLYAWRYRGEAPVGYRLGGHVRFRRTDVEAWLEQRRENDREDTRPSNGRVIQ